MNFLRLFLVGFSLVAQASIWNGVDEATVPLLSPVDLKDAKKISLHPTCRDLLAPFVSAFSNDLALIRGKTIPYPRQSKKVGKRSQRLEKVYLDISDPSQDARAAKMIAEGSGNVSTSAEIEGQIKKFRARNFKKVSFVEFLPDFVKKEMGLVLDCDGPNCYNTAMRFHDLEKTQVETYDYEVVQYIQKKYKALKPQSNLQFGDLIVFWVGGEGEKLYQGNIRHTAVYMGQGIVLHKASTSKGDPVTFEDLQRVMEYYRDLKSSFDSQHTVSFHRLK